MNSILEKLKLLGFEIKVAYSKGIYAKRELPNAPTSMMVSIGKDYKGYKVEFTEFIGNNFGRSKKFETKKAKDIIMFLNDTVK